MQSWVFIELLNKMIVIKLQELVLLLVILNLANAQYEGEYDVEDHSSYEGDSSDGPDYSRYYAGDTGSSAGFTTPGDFSGFFGPSFFAASNKQEVTKENPQFGFVKNSDFKAPFSEFNAGAGPFAGKDYFDDSNKKGTDLEIKPGPSYVSHKVVPPNAKYGSEADELIKPQTFGPSKKSKIPPVPLYSSNKQPLIDPKYIPQYTPKNPNNFAPYQRYGYQTSEILDFKPSNPEPKYQSPSTEFKPIKAPQKYKSCRKITKSNPGKSLAADCYVCKDNKGANYEECSYTSESNPKNYYIESTKQYSQPEKVESFRFKRYTVQQDDKDPYEYIKTKSNQYYNDPDFEATYPKNEKFSFSPDYFVDAEEKSSSEQHADRLVKSGESCEKVHRDGMICTVCRDKRTGGNYEQCSYSTEPEEKKYAYVKERRYNSEDDDEGEGAEEEETDSSQDRPKKQRYQERKDDARDGDEVERIKPINTHRRKSEYTVPKHFERITVEPEKTHESEEDYDDYYYRYAPEESRREEQQEDTDDDSHGYYGEENQKDVEEVLAEFAKKDRSKCKKSEKNGMTCYLCTDKKGLQHEECMYVSESRPQSNYHAYHAKKETKEPRNEETKVKSFRVRLAEPQMSESQHGPNPNNKRYKTKRQNYNKKAPKRNYRRTKNTEDKNDKYRVDAEGPEGAFSHETEPVYSKEYGTTLPRFMLTKSEGERLYDELARGFN